MNSSYEEQEENPLAIALHLQENEEPPTHITVLIVMVKLLETILQSLNIQEDTTPSIIPLTSTNDRKVSLESA